MAFFTQKTEVKDRFGDSHEEVKVRVGRIIFVAVLTLILLIGIFGSFSIVKTGESGILVTLGQVTQTSLSPGAHLKIPVISKIERVNVKQQDIIVTDKVWSESSERTAVYCEGITVSYTIVADEAAWIYSNVTQYKEHLITSDLVASAIKASSKRFNSTDVTNRSLIEPAVSESLQNALNEKYGKTVVVVNKIIISNIDFDDSYNNAIAEKQNAQIAYEQQQIENKRAIEKAEADAQVKQKNAEAEANAQLIKAKAEAEANDLLTKSMSEAILRNKYYEKWNGELPQIVGGESNLLIDMP